MNTHYIPENPCKRGHRLRYSKDNKCVECHLMFKRFRQQLETVLKCKDDTKIHVVGYSKQQLKSHLESKFKHYMTWDNYGEIWSIDHVIPLKKFVDNSILESTIVNHLDNLQPLHWRENLCKGCK